VRPQQPTALAAPAALACGQETVGPGPNYGQV